MLTRTQKEKLQARLMDENIMCEDPNFTKITRAVELFIDDAGFKIPTFTDRITEDAQFSEIPNCASIGEETDKAIEQGLTNAKQAWKFAAIEIVRRTAEHYATFTVNDFRDELDRAGVSTHDNRAMGGIMRTAASNGWIKASGETIKSRTGHGSPLQVWQSLIWKKHNGVKIAVNGEGQTGFF